jgi:hypothetical protein
MRTIIPCGGPLEEVVAVLAVGAFDDAPDGVPVLPRVVRAQAETRRTSSIGAAVRILSRFLPMCEVI